MILNDDDLILPAELARNGEMMTTHFGFQHVDGRDHVHGSEVRHVVTTPCITVHRCPEIHHHRAPPTVWQPSGFGGEITTAAGGFENHTAYSGFGVNWPNSLRTSIEDLHNLEPYSVSDYNDMVLTRRSKRSFESEEGALGDEPNGGNNDGVELPIDTSVFDTEGGREDAASTAHTLITLLNDTGDSERLSDQGEGGGTSQLMSNRGDVGGLILPPIKMRTTKKTKSSQLGSIGKLLFLMPDIGDGGGLGRNFLKVTSPHERMSQLYTSLLRGELNADVYREHDGIFEFGDETFLVAIEVARADLSARGLFCELNDPVQFQNCLDDFHAVIANFRFMNAR